MFGTPHRRNLHTRIAAGLAPLIHGKPKSSRGLGDPPTRDTFGATTLAVEEPAPGYGSGRRPTTIRWAPIGNWWAGVGPGYGPHP